MDIVESRNPRVIDTFAARELNELRRYPTIDSVVEYGIRTGYSLGAAFERPGINRVIKKGGPNE